MNTEDILKGLRSCIIAGACRECPFDGTSEDGAGCSDKLHVAAAALIKQQAAEIEKEKSLLAPCEVGTTVYLIDKELLAVDPQNCTLYEDVVYEVGRGRTSDGSVRWLCLVEDTGLDFYDTDIGVTAFFDYEAGLEKLRELCEGEEADE